MKKVFKILFLLFITFFVICIFNAVKANSISKIDLDIYVDSSGNATVTETWICNVNKGTEVYHPYYNLGNSKITNLTVSENGKEYTPLSTWKTSGSLSSKAYKCGINKITNGIELCWGISEYGNHTYTAKYNISNFVSKLTDSQMIYWTLIPYDFSEPIGSSSIIIHTDFDFSNTTDVWGYGNYGGTCYVYDGCIEMHSAGKLSSNEYMTILVKLPEGTFNATNQLDHDFNYYYKMAQEGSTAYNKKSSSSISYAIIPVVMIVTLWPIWLMIIFIIVKSLKKDKFDFGPDGKSLSKSVPYFRDIPCDGDIFRAYYIANKYEILSKKTDLLGAIILKWVKDSLIRLEQREGGKIFKKEDTVIILNETDTRLITDNYERTLFNMLYEASKDGILENKEFEKWCKDGYSRILNWFNNIIKEQEKILIEKGLIIKSERKRLGIFKSKVYTATHELRVEAEQLYGLKRFLLDYTLVPDREPLQVHMLEEYLIYAQMLGIAKQVAKDFKELYPDIIAQSHYNSYDYVLFVHIYSTNAVHAANTAQSRARSYSSGGGGFSSGGGGGGSFGGGGGGRWRFPLNQNLFLILKI